MMYVNIHEVEAPKTQDDIPPEVEVLKVRKQLLKVEMPKAQMRGSAAPGLVEFCSELTK